MKFDAAYLGNGINKETRIRHETLNIMQEVRQTWFKLLPYWKATNANMKWQLPIFDAVVSRFRLNNLESEFMYRKPTNREVLNVRTALAYPNRGVDASSNGSANLGPVGNLLGHVLRASHDDSMRQISVQPNCAFRVSYWELMGINETVARDKIGCIKQKPC